MNAGYKESIRLNQLLTMALKGSNEESLRKKCQSWKMSNQKENEYVNKVIDKIKSFKSKASAT